MAIPLQTGSSNIPIENKRPATHIFIFCHLLCLNEYPWTRACQQILVQILFESNAATPLADDAVTFLICLLGLCSGRRISSSSFISPYRGY